MSLLINAQMTVSGAPGTGLVTLGAATAGAQSFAAAGAVDGATYSYRIEEGAAWEVGQGVYTAQGTTLSRATILGSSAAGNAVTFTAAAIVSQIVLPVDLPETGAAVGFSSGVTSSTGTLGSANVVGRYVRIGARLVYVEFVLTVQSNGDAGGALGGTLPFAAAAAAVLLGRESAATGRALVGVLSANSKGIFIVNYDNTYPGGTGYQLLLSGVYEIAP